VQETLIAPGKWTPACGAAAVSTLLARGARFSALVASNDDMAIGAIKRLHEAGVMVPDEVSVVGLTTSPGPYVIPALSSVKMPVNGMIQETINRLITMVEEGSRDALPAFSGT
jgi:LacI family asc operon transcriptional repressor